MNGGQHPASRLRHYARSAHAFGGQVLIALLPALMRAVPPTNTCVVNGTPDSEGNSIEVLRAALRRPYRRVYWLVERVETAPTWALNGVEGLEKLVIAHTGSVRGFAATVRARLVFHTHGLYGSPRPRRGRIHVNLWHGDGPKRTTNPAFSVHCRSTVLVSASRQFGLDKAAELGMSPERLLFTGNPRIDAFERPATDGELAGLGIDPAKPLVLWMPTYRSTGGVSAHLWRDAPDLNTRPGVREMLGNVADFCAHSGVEFRVKPHPFDAELIENDRLQVLRADVLAAHQVLLYSLLSRTNVLLTDYSSVWTDFLVLDRPIGFFWPDIDDYRDGRGLVHDPESLVLPGPVVKDSEGMKSFLADALERDSHRGRRHAAASELGVVLHPGATNRLMDALDTLFRDGPQRLDASDRTAVHAGQRRHRVSRLVG